MSKLKNNSLYFLFLLFFILFLLERSPEIFFNGRFFAEEGAVWWSYSLVNSYLNTLIYSPASGGYVCLICNLQIMGTKLVPIQFGPFFTVYSSVIISFLPSFTMLQLSKNSINNISRIYISILLLILPSMNFLEVFANSISSPQFLAISVFIILIYGLKNNRFIKFQYLTIFIGFLSYYYSLFLLPCFVLRYFQTKSKFYKIPIIFGLFSVLVHLNVIIFLLTNQSFFYRNFSTSFEFYPTINNLALSFSINFFGEKLYRENGFQYFSLIIVFALILVFINNENKHKVFITAIALIGQIILIYFGQIGESYYGRYAVVASTIAIFIIFHLFSEKKYFIYIFTILLLISFNNFRTQGGKYFISCDSYCTSWQEQILYINNGDLDKYIHWPMGEGEPFWFTEVLNPLPNPSPYQKSVLGEEYLKLYNLNFIDILKNNLKYLKNY